MKKTLILILLMFAACAVFAQDKPKEKPKPQFIMIVRSKTDFSSFSKEAIQDNIRHWQAYMGKLAQAGKIAGGYRPGNEGETVNSPAEGSKKGYYAENGLIVSSFLIINAADMNEAANIAKQCPVFDLGGNIEIRPLMNIAN